MITETLKKYKKYIKDYNIIRFRQVEDTYELNISVIFIDDSELIARDYLFFDCKRKYSYYYQNKSKNLIFRYDNAPHWEHLKTTPYHKHVKNEVFESNIMTFDKVLEEIINILKI